MGTFLKQINSRDFDEIPEILGECPKSPENFRIIPEIPDGPRMTWGNFVFAVEFVSAKTMIKLVLQQNMCTIQGIGLDLRIFLVLKNKNTYYTYTHR